MTILIKNPNFLILDEPTNDLDIATLSILEDFLMNFQGCLLVVTHDRYFMDKMVDHLFVFEGVGVVRDFPGNYTEYRDRKEQEDKVASKESKASQQVVQKSAAAEKAESAVVAEVKAPPVSVAPKKKLSFKEKSELEELEKTIAKLETEKTDLTEKLSSGDANHQDVMKWTERIGIVINELDEKSLRWLELSEGI